MIQQLQVDRLCAGTLFQIYFVGFVFTFYPIAVLAGISAAFGADTVQSHGVQIHGWKAIVDMIVAPPLLALFFSGFMFVCTAPGLWIFSKFKKMLIAYRIDTSDPALQPTGTGRQLPPATQA